VSAQLRLRSGPARLAWPAGEAAAVVVLLGDATEPVCRWLTDAGALVLIAPVRDWATTLGWAADHAAELGAGQAPLILAGVGDAVAVVASLARDERWPRIACRLLVDPPKVTVLGGGAGRYVAALRRAGLAVRELGDL
jgi:hypothetical protein